MMDESVRRASAPAWMLCIACLSPAVGRLARGAGRYLDPIWALVFLLAINRLSFVFRVSLLLSHLSAMCLALLMAWCATWYQRRDT